MVNFPFVTWLLESSPGNTWPSLYHNCNGTDFSAFHHHHHHQLKYPHRHHHQAILGQVFITIAMALISLLVQTPSVPSFVHLWLASCQVLIMTIDHKFVEFFDLMTFSNVFDSSCWVLFYIFYKSWTSSQMFVNWGLFGFCK